MILDAQRDNTQLCDMGRQALSHTHVCVIFCAQACATRRETEKMCVRRGVLSSPTVACTTFADLGARNLWVKSTSA